MTRLKSGDTVLKKECFVLVKKLVLNYDGNEVVDRLWHKMIMSLQAVAHSKAMDASFQIPGLTLPRC